MSERRYDLLISADAHAVGNNADKVLFRNAADLYGFDVDYLVTHRPQVAAA